jgi:hypothetical protein
MANIVSLEVYHEQDGLDQNGNDITFSEKWLLLINTRSSPVVAHSLISALAVGNAYGFVPRNQPHPDNSALKSTGFRIERSNELGLKFIVYNTFSNSQADQADSSDPENDFDRATYRYEEVDNYVDVNIDPITDKIIAHTNGQSVIPAPRESKPLTRIVITRNERNYSDKKASGYRNKLNRSPVKIKGEVYARRTAKLESWSAVTAFDQDGEEYFIHTYKVLINPDEHKRTFISAGIQNKAGRITVAGRPIKLKQDGSFYSLADQGDPEVFTSFSNYTLSEIDWSGLRL